MCTNHIASKASCNDRSIAAICIDIGGSLEVGSSDYSFTLHTVRRVVFRVYKPDGSVQVRPTHFEDLAVRFGGRGRRGQVGQGVGRSGVSGGR